MDSGKEQAESRLGSGSGFGLNEECILQSLLIEALGLELGSVRTLLKK